MDYEVDSILYKARDFGAPQNRERIYIVGFDKLSLKNIDLFEFPTAPKPKTCVGDILEDSVDEKYTISDTLWEGHKRRKLEHKEKGNGFGFLYSTPVVLIPIQFQHATIRMVVRF